MSSKECPICGDTFLTYHSGQGVSRENLRSDATACIRNRTSDVQEMWVHLPESRMSVDEAKIGNL